MSYPFECPAWESIIYDREQVKSAELSDRKVSLKEIEKARSERRRQVRAGLGTRTALVDRYVEMHHTPPPAPKTVAAEPAPVEARPRRKPVCQ